jgi:hypothetical protein
MCLEGMLTNALKQIPVIKYFTPLISIAIFIAAMYFSLKTGSPAHIIGAYFCPLFYLIYHFATKGMSGKKKGSDNNENSSDTNSNPTSI